MADGSLNPLLERVELTQFPKTPRGAIAVCTCPHVSHAQVIKSSMTIREAVEFLHHHNILSAPVLDDSKSTSEASSWREKYLGLLDVIKRTISLEIFSFLVCVVMLDAMEQKSTIKEEAEGEDVGYSFTLDPLPSEFVNRKVSEFAGWSQFIPFHRHSCSLLTSIQMAARRSCFPSFR
jgi:hypothetical protein